MAYLGSVASEPLEYSVGRGSGSLESREFQTVYLGIPRIANSRNLAEFPNSEFGILAEFPNCEFGIAKLPIGILRIADDD